MPQKSFAQGRLRHLLPFAHKVKTALSLPWDNPNKHQRDELDDNAGLAIVHQAKANLSIDSSSSIPIIIGTRWPYTDYDLHCGCNSFKVPQSSCCFRKNPLEEKRSLLGFRSSHKALDGKKNKHWADIVDRWFCEYHFQCWQQLVVSSLQIQER